MNNIADKEPAIVFLRHSIYNINRNLNDAYDGCMIPNTSEQNLINSNCLHIKKKSRKIIVGFKDVPQNVCELRLF